MFKTGLHFITEVLHIITHGLQLKPTQFCITSQLIPSNTAFQFHNKSDNITTQNGTSSRWCMTNFQQKNVANSNKKGRRSQANSGLKCQKISVTATPSCQQHYQNPCSHFYTIIIIVINATIIRTTVFAENFNEI